MHKQYTLIFGKVGLHNRRRALLRGRILGRESSDRNSTKVTPVRLYCLLWRRRVGLQIGVGCCLDDFVPGAMVFQSIPHPFFSCCWDSLWVWWSFGTWKVGYEGHLSGGQVSGAESHLHQPVLWLATPSWVWWNVSVCARPAVPQCGTWRSETCLMSFRFSWCGNRIGQTWTAAFRLYLAAATMRHGFGSCPGWFGMAEWSNEKESNDNSLTCAI